MALDRVVLLETARWQSDISRDPIDDTDEVTASFTVWAERRDLGESIYVEPIHGLVTQVKRVEYLIRDIPEFHNYLRISTQEDDSAFRITDGDLRLIIVGAQEAGRGRFIVLSCRTPQVGEAGSNVEWRNHGL